jgi:dipeptidyl aminopeptidase/acylaminoacyl peptidase
MRRLLIVSLALIAFSFSTAAQSKHPFTFEDMMKLKRVGDPQVSPDGKWVIFSVVDVDLAANTKTPHIWLVRVGADASSAPERSSAGSSAAEKILIADPDADRPRWAPDGKRIAFLSTKEDGSQIWIADFDGTGGKVSGVHRLTAIATEASGELWSPDGKNILFTSDVYPECDGEPAAESACNAKRLKDAQQSKVKAQIFSHLLYRHWNAFKEGKRTHIFVVSASPTSLSTTTNSAGIPALRPVALNLQSIPTSSAEVSARLPVPSVKPLRLGGGPMPLMESPFPRDLTPGDYDAPVFSLGGQDDYAFSPDGHEICYASNHDKNPAASTNNDLWIVPVNVGAGASPAQVLAKTKNITADNPASDSSPLYSPDGRYIAYRAQQRPGYESDRFRLMLYDRKTGEKKNLTEDFDRWIDGFTWAPSSKTIYFDAEDKGTAPVWALELIGQHASLPKELFRSGTNGDVAITPDGKSLIFTRNTVQSPVAIFAAKLADLPEKPAICGEKTPDFFVACPEKAAVALTHLNNAVLSPISMSEILAFGFVGAKNESVEGFLVKPPNFDASKKYPVKFLIHGGPQGAWGDDWSYRWNPELFAANGYVVIMINFHGSTGYGQKFIDAINGDWGGAPFEDLMKGLDYAEQTYPFIDKTRECALGASYGGYMANWILGHADRFKCIVSHDGMFNAESAWGSTEEMWFNNWEFKGTPYDNRESYVKWSPHRYAKNFKTPTLVIHGQRDYRLDVSEGFQLFTTLQMEGIPSKMLYFPDEGHWVLKPQNSQLWYKTVNDWVDQWTK